jgi:hypothetical protein
MGYGVSAGLIRVSIPVGDKKGVLSQHPMYSRAFSSHSPNSLLWRESNRMDGRLAHNLWRNTI